MLKKIVLLFVFICLILSCLGLVQAEDTDNITDIDTNDTVIKSYSDLQDLVDNAPENSTLVLTDSYKYNSSSDELLKDGVSILKNMTIVGDRDVYIDGNKISRCLYIGSDCHVILKNITFKNGYSKNNGAGVYLNESSNLTLYNCVFHDNYVYNSDGGALNAQVGTNVDIYNCEFFNNTSVRVSNLAWDSYKCGMGSAICVRINSSLNMYDSKFHGNNAFLATILLISYDDVIFKLSTIFVKNCIFENNHVTNRGVIYLDELGKGEFIDSVFRNNTIAHSGGTLELDTAKSALVQNCLFEDNSAVNGGAINIKIFESGHVSNANVKDCVFRNNKASSYGGAIASRYGITQISNCKFYNNTAGTQGGAIASKYGKIQISNSNFHNNGADYGGAIYILSEDSSVLKSTFVQNVANIKGGAIYSKSIDISSSNCKYSKNSAPISNNVYGVFITKITYSTYNSKNIKLKVKISSPWKISAKQKIKVKISGTHKFTSKWVKTNSKGILTLIIPSKVKITKNKIKISIETGVISIKSVTKIKDSAKFYYSKKIKKPSKIEITAKNKATKKLIKKTKFKVKIYTGKKYKTVKVKTNSKGILKLNTKKLSKGLHKINIILNNKKYDVNKKFYVRIK